MSQRFLDFIPFILEWETEYNKDGSVKVERDPDDPGGTTKYGIDQRSHPNEDVENLTEQDAIDIYEIEWTQAGCDHFPPKLGEVYFNCRVNAGSGRAQKCLTSSNGDPSKFLDAQEQFYKNLAANKPVMRKYLKGWLNRTQALRKYLQLS